MRSATTSKSKHGGSTSTCCGSVWSEKIPCSGRLSSFLKSAFLLMSLSCTLLSCASSPEPVLPLSVESTGKLTTQDKLILRELLGNYDGPIWIGTK